MASDHNVGVRIPPGAQLIGARLISERLSKNSNSLPIAKVGGGGAASKQKDLCFYTSFLIQYSRELMNLSTKIKKLVDLIESEGVVTKDLKPVTIVGKITTAAQQLFPEDKDKDFLQIVQETYIKLLTDKGIEPIKARQSWVVASGGDFEGYIRNHINQVLNSEQ